MERFVLWVVADVFRGVKNYEKKIMKPERKFRLII